MTAKTNRTTKKTELSKEHKEAWAKFDIPPVAISESTARRRAAENKRKAKEKTHDREYRVTWDSERRRYNVETDDGRRVGFNDRQSGAIGQAIQSAKADQAAGINAVVCVQQKDGGWTMAWHGPV